MFHPCSTDETASWVKLLFESSQFKSSLLLNKLMTANIYDIIFLRENYSAHELELIHIDHVEVNRFDPMDQIAILKLHHSWPSDDSLDMAPFI